jgi:hypothetical protein
MEDGVFLFLCVCSLLVVVIFFIVDFFGCSDIFFLIEEGGRHFLDIVI